MYYLRTKPATNAIQFTVDKLSLKEKAGAGPKEKEKEAKAVPKPVAGLRAFGKENSSPALVSTLALRLQLNFRP